MIKKKTRLYFEYQCLINLYSYSLQGDLDEEIPESCTSSDDDLELDETNLGEGLSGMRAPICTNQWQYNFIQHIKIRQSKNSKKICEG